MEPVSIYFGAIAEIINILSEPGPKFLRFFTAISILLNCLIIFSRYECFMSPGKTEDVMPTIIVIAIISTGFLLFSFPNEGIAVLICTLPILFFRFLWHIGCEDLTFLIIGLAILHFFEFSTNTLLIVIILYVYLWKLIISKEYEKLHYSHNNLVNSYNLVIKERDDAIRERNVAIEERDELEAKQRKFSHLNSVYE
ncbi:hypothetical protein [Bartonella bilalgolemii]|uniref:Uncharacterized protein n=1 Tax=Bartonella bilalgolemii TaxID=2942911 RepID=A0ABT0P981_9HYPH|nr:hypothetical protein [Bartonella sp. G70]MCL6230028.1 hypothetical protein [Bartonella sp. G70]